MFTILELTSAKSIAQGTLVVGGTSGARAYMVDAITNSDQCIVYQVEGNFVKNEMLTADGEQIETIAALHSYQYSDVRQYVARDESTNAIEFTADPVLEDAVLVEGSTFQYSTTLGDVKTVDSIGAADFSRTAGTYVVTTFTTDVTTNNSKGAKFSIVVDGSGAATVTVLDGGFVIRCR